MGLLGVLVGGGFYLLLIDTTSLPELYALAGVALACGAVFAISREEGYEEARIRLVWLLGAWRVAAKIPLDIGLVCRAAVAQLIAPKPARGSFRAVRFRATQSTPEGTARRALAEGLGSVTPNTVVVGIDAERGWLLVHQLERRGDDRELDVMRMG
jgi:hypothetical protein